MPTSAVTKLSCFVICSRCSKRTPYHTTINFINTTIVGGNFREERLSHCVLVKGCGIVSKFCTVASAFQCLGRLHSILSDIPQIFDAAVTDTTSVFGRGSFGLIWKCRVGRVSTLSVLVNNYYGKTKNLYFPPPHLTFTTLTSASSSSSFHSFFERGNRVRSLLFSSRLFFVGRKSNIQTSDHGISRRLYRIW